MWRIFIFLIRELFFFLVVGVHCSTHCDTRCVLARTTPTSIVCAGTFSGQNIVDSRFPYHSLYACVCAYSSQIAMKQQDTAAMPFRIQTEWDRAIYSKVKVTSRNCYSVVHICATQKRIKTTRKKKSDYKNDQLPICIRVR